MSPNDHPTSSSSTPTAGPSVPLKRRRVTRACDRCHKGGIRCYPGRTPLTCGPCESFGETCTYDRPAKRRGPVAQSARKASTDARRSPPGRTPDSSPNVGRPKRKSTAGDATDDVWKADHVASAAIIEQLVDSYHRICYPILPYFHWPTYSHDVRRRRYLLDQPFFTSTMAVCAMASARLRDGAVIPHLAPLDPSCPPSEVFYAAAMRSIPKDLLQAGDFDYKRAKALLTMLCIQYGRVVETKLHLGELSTMFSLEAFHNEAKWPPGLNPIEVEERRRLAWAVYQLDIYASIVFGMMTHHRESQMTVAYPTEVFDDTEITASGFIPPRSSKGVSFFRGWNLVVDLYRILEHATDRLRAGRIGGSTLDVVTGLVKSGPDDDEILEIVSNLYEALPVEFKLVKAMTGDLEKDRYGFTATNIIITLQTLRSVIAGFHDSNVHQRCTIAAEMLDSLASVPVSYIQAGSAPMFHHLAGVGHLLGSIIQSPLSQHTYLRVRTVLLALADMTASLEAALSATSDNATRLRAHVSRIDNYMTEAALQHQHAYPSVASNVTNTMAHPYSTPMDVNRYPPSVLGMMTAQTDHMNMRLPQGNHMDEASHGHSDKQSQPRSVDVISNIPAGEPTSSGHPDAGGQASNYSWRTTADASANYQIQLPDDLCADWPFDFGQGDVFDWLGDIQGQAQAADGQVAAVNSGLM